MARQHRGQCVNRRAVRLLGLLFLRFRNVCLYAISASLHSLASPCYVPRRNRIPADHSRRSRTEDRQQLSGRGVQLDVPDRREDLPHVGRVDLGEPPAADAGEGVPLHVPPPVLRVPPAAPAAALLFEHALSGLRDRGNTLDAAILCQRVTAGPRQLAVGEGALAGFGERDEHNGAESEFAAPTADAQPLDPASRSGWLDEQVQAVAVGVPSWRGGTDEGGRKHLVGMTVSALMATQKQTDCSPSWGAARVSGAGSLRRRRRY